MDATSKVENGVWRYNTLAHYKVENKATLALLPRQASSYNLSLLSDRSEKSSLSLHNNSPTFTRPFGTTGSSHSKDQQYSSSTLKAYHLVKPAADHGPQDNQVWLSCACG